MLIIAIFPLLLAVLGAIVYAVAVNPKVSELGRLAYACGLLALAFALAQHVVHIG